MRKRTILAASAIVAVGCIAIPTGAYAANGGSWLLGRSNSESATTTVTHSGGTPLSLNAKSGYAPLKVNSSKVVTNLNADKVDGYSASSFAMRSGRTGTIAHDGSIDGLGAKCPTGTVFVSGGGFAPGAADYIYYSGPDWNAVTDALIPNSWIVISDTGVGVSNVTCYQPSGAPIPGVATSFLQTTGQVPALADTGRGAALSDTAVAKIGQIKELKSAPAPTAAK